MIVVDASVMVDFLLNRPRAHDAVVSELAQGRQDHLKAPQLVEPETLNALRRLAGSGAITDRRADEAVSDFADVRLIRYPHEPLRLRVWELRHELTAYDATYLALAEALDEAVMLTSDAPLANRARASLGIDRVRLIG